MTVIWATTSFAPADQLYYVGPKEVGPQQLWASEVNLVHSKTWP